VQHGGGTVTQGAPRALCLPHHMVCIGAENSVLKPKRAHMSCVSDASNTESESNFMKGANACPCEWYRAWICRTSKRMVSNLEQVSSFDFKNRTHIKFV
jgi:hypothetical protein